MDDHKHLPHVHVHVAGVRVFSSCQGQSPGTSSELRYPLRYPYPVLATDVHDPLTTYLTVLSLEGNEVTHSTAVGCFRSGRDQSDGIFITFKAA